ncbi:MAG: CopG family transcriptional regulator [Pseudomonadota bacterium]
MSQVTIYMDEEAISRAKASAAAAKLSLSAWISQLIKEQTSAVDANGYPVGFFEEISAQAGAWKDFPLSPSLRAGDTPDLPRETL